LELPLLDPKPTKPVSPTIIDAYQQTVPNPKTLGAAEFVPWSRWGGSKNAPILFANDFFGFAVRRGDCFVSFGSMSKGPPIRKSSMAKSNLGAAIELVTARF
jgi:hypothetical protein